MEDRERAKAEFSAAHAAQIRGQTSGEVVSGVSNAFHSTLQLRTINRALKAFADDITGCGLDIDSERELYLLIDWLGCTEDALDDALGMLVRHLGLQRKDLPWPTEKLR
jgi:hypothetical protein